MTRRTILVLVGLLCSVGTFSQTAKLVFKKHPEFQRYPIQLIKETTYSLVDPQVLSPDDSLTFSIEIKNPEGEYFRLWNWAALTLFLKPGSELVVEYNARERYRTKFEGDVAKENAWLNQVSFQNNTLRLDIWRKGMSYKEFKRELTWGADSLKRTVKGVTDSRTFMKNAEMRIDLLKIRTLMNYQNLVSWAQEEKMSPEEFKVWNEVFKKTFMTNFLKDARTVMTRHREKDIIGCTQAVLTLGDICGLYPDFAREIGFTSFDEQYAFIRLQSDPQELYGPGIQDFYASLRDSVVREKVKIHIETNRALMIGADVMDFEFRDMEGETHRLSDYKGMPMYIDVWATWCNPCKALAPSFHELAEEYKGRDIKFISISLDKKTAPWINYLKQQEHSENVLELHAGKSDFAKSYKIDGIPRFIIIDKDFKIRMALGYRPIEYCIKDLKNLLDQLEKE